MEQGSSQEVQVTVEDMILEHCHRWIEGREQDCQDSVECLPFLELT